MWGAESEVDIEDRSRNAEREMNISRELQARLGAVLNDGLSPGSERYDKIGRVGGELAFGNRG
jgi:hypothetical protein